MAGPGGGGRPGGGAPRSGGRGESENSLLLSLMRELTGSLSALSHLAHQAAISHQTAARHADAFGKKLDFGSHAVTSFGHALLAGAHLHKMYQGSVESAARAADAKAQSDARWAATQKRWASQLDQQRNRANPVVASRAAAQLPPNVRTAFRIAPNASTASAGALTPDGATRPYRSMDAAYEAGWDGKGPVPRQMLRSKEEYRRELAKLPPNRWPAGSGPASAGSSAPTLARRARVSDRTPVPGLPSIQSILSAPRVQTPQPLAVARRPEPGLMLPRPRFRPMPESFGARLTAAPGGGMGGLMKGLGGVAKLAGPAAIGLLAFGAGLEIAAKATQMAAGVLSYAAQKASPQTWNTLTKSFDLVAATLGAKLVPGMMRWAAWLQQTAIEAEMGVGVGGRLMSTFQLMATAMDAVGRGAVHVVDTVGKLAQAMESVQNSGFLKGMAQGAGLQDKQGEPTWLGKLAGQIADGATGGLFGAVFGKKAGPGNPTEGGVAAQRAIVERLGKQLAIDTKMAQPRFSAVEQVWEQAALGFLSDSELDRQILQKQLESMELQRAEYIRQTQILERMLAEQPVPRK